MSSLRVSNPRHGVRVFLLSLALAALGLVGCAGGFPMSLSADGVLIPHPELTEERILEPLGPGHVFASPRAAAIDALAYSYQLSRERPLDLRRARGGSIQSVDGGFSYEEPTVGPRGGMNALRYRLRPSDVAHFQHYPVARAAYPTGHFRSIERNSRRYVQDVDPIQRPLFYMTPRRVIAVYDASQAGEEILARVRYGTPRDATNLALHVPPGGTSDDEARPLAMGDGAL